MPRIDVSTRASPAVDPGQYRCTRKHHDGGNQNEGYPLPADTSAEPRRSSFDALLQDAAALGPVPVAVVHPCDALSLQGALQAARVGLIEPILVGPQAKIRRAADVAALDISA